MFRAPESTPLKKSPSPAAEPVSSWFPSPVAPPTVSVSVSSGCPPPTNETGSAIASNRAFGLAEKKRSDASSGIGRGLRHEATRQLHELPAGGVAVLELRERVPPSASSLASPSAASKPPFSLSICARRSSVLTTLPTPAAPLGISSESSNFFDGHRMASTAKVRPARPRTAALIEQRSHVAEELRVEFLGLFHVVVPAVREDQQVGRLRRVEMLLERGEVAVGHRRALAVLVELDGEVWEPGDVWPWAAPRNHTNWMARITSTRPWPSNERSRPRLVAVFWKISLTRSG